MAWVAHSYGPYAASECLLRHASPAALRQKEPVTSPVNYFRFNPNSGYSFALAGKSEMGPEGDLRANPGLLSTVL